MSWFSLKARVAIVGLIPTVFFLAMTLNMLNGQYAIRNEADELASRIHVISIASNLVNETQKERGMTAGFLSGGVELDSLNEQHKETDKKREAFVESLKSSSFEKAYKQEVLETVEKYTGLRDAVSIKAITIAEAVKSYTSLVKALLQMDNYVAENTSLSEVTSKLIELRVLEDVKEAGGKLRANMTRILAANKAIKANKLQTIVNLRAELDAGLQSSVLVLDEETTTIIDTFRKSKEWQNVTNIFTLIVDNHSQGNYYQDAAQFFEIMTTALNNLGRLVQYKKEVLVGIVDRAKSDSTVSLWFVSLICLAMLIIVALLNFSISSKIDKAIMDVAGKLTTYVGGVSAASKKLASTSDRLNSSSSSQAASVQQTVSSVDEIGSMVSKSAESANSSTKVSAQSKRSASQGKEKINEMIAAINEIAATNNEIMQEIDNNNKEVTKIVDVIGDIGEKTKVINDIVFQTKLLSFNASVEAARAGEHGSGFAVVAEEVGNLASMSGNAAQEITAMLDRSTKQVSEIVENSKTKIERLIKIGSGKIDTGTKTANECEKTLDEILANATSVSGLVDDIARACNEQATGVNEITNAMRHIDQSSNENSRSAQESAEVAAEVKQQSENLKQAVDELTALVQGEATAKKLLGKQKAPAPTQTLEKSQRAAGADKNIIPLAKPRTKAAEPTPPQSGLKVAGSTVEVPSASDSRFEDL